ncbi:hypothetical protein ACMFMG_009458 [Clarireedia jacksonii]
MSTKEPTLKHTATISVTAEAAQDGMNLELNQKKLKQTRRLTYLFAALPEARDPETGHGYTGSDTMATAITSTTFYLLHYPDTLKRLNKEVPGTFADVEDIRDGSQFTNCTYLTAYLNEAMRITPGVGGLLPREISPR